MGGMGAVDLPWYKSFVSNIRDLIHPPKLTPLEVTSKPVEVKTIWGAYQGAEKKSGAVSVLIHVGIVALLLVIFQAPGVRNAIKKTGEIIYLPAFKPKLPPAAEKMSGGGGGGHHGGGGGSTQQGGGGGRQGGGGPARPCSRRRGGSWTTSTRSRTRSWPTTSASTREC